MITRTLIITSLLTGVQGCELISGSREREVVTFVRMESTNCDLIIEKHSFTDTSDSEGGLTTPKDEKFIIRQDTD
jgi:hypothetical protein